MTTTFLKKVRRSGDSTVWCRAHQAASAVALAAMWLALLMSSGDCKDQLTQYSYKDTQNLVSLVEDAAGLIETKGDEAFKEFAKKDSKWFNGDYYLFAYTIDGTTVFHPLRPDLVGQNVMDLKDMNGKQIIRQITDIGRQPASDASGWVFYLWEDRTQITPTWKAAYIRKVVTPDRKTYVVGSGSYNIKMEKAFVEERVNRAARFLQIAGKAEAFEQFRSPASPFFFLDSYIFVINEQGETVIDPAFPNKTGRTVIEFQDAVGFFAFKNALEKLEHADEAWVQYLWPKPGSSTPSRKLIYVRKVKVGGEVFIVGSDFFLATPIWLRV
jgi:signal transduction histidine kinase